MEVVASLSQGRTAAAQCGLFTHKSVPVIFEPPCTTPVCDEREGTTLMKAQVVKWPQQHVQPQRHNPSVPSQPTSYALSTQSCLGHRILRFAMRVTGSAHSHLQN